MYKASSTPPGGDAGAAGAAGADNGAKAPDAEKKDNVVDAEFVDVDDKNKK